MFEIKRPSEKRDIPEVAIRRRTTKQANFGEIFSIFLLFSSCGSIKERKPVYKAFALAIFRTVKLTMNY